jgi:hypothetical protein
MSGRQTLPDLVSSGISTADVYQLGVTCPDCGREGIWSGAMMCPTLDFLESPD